MNQKGWCRTAFCCAEGWRALALFAVPMGVSNAVGWSPTQDRLNVQANRPRRLPDSSCDGFFSKRHFDEPRLAIARMTMTIVEHRAEHPLLGSRVPVGPRVAADAVAATSSARNGNPSVVFCHQTNLPSRNSSARHGSTRLVRSGRGAGLPVRREQVS